VITHQGSYCRRPAGLDLIQRLKHLVVERTPSVAPSRAVADSFRTDSTRIANPYDAGIFHLSSPVTKRPSDLIFVGRLVSEKGVDLLLEALSRLKAQELFPSLTIVGDGPERPLLEKLSERLGLGAQVRFAGAKRGADLADVLHRHRILVIPSRYAEPFGVVALEGIACGCVVVGSSEGGLPEAIGPCGLTFPNGDVQALTETMSKLLREPNECERLRVNAGAHLDQFKSETIAQSYLTLFRKLL
jgi:glycosyltransferase involved in cell wall biosynthesis